MTTLTRKEESSDNTEMVLDENRWCHVRFKKKYRAFPFSFTFPFGWAGSIYIFKNRYTGRNRSTKWYTVKQLLFASEKISRASPQRIFLAANQPFWFGCNNNTGHYKTYLRKLVVVNQFVSS